MRIVVFLENPIPAFEPTAEQLASLAGRLPNHALIRVLSESEFLEQLPQADVVVVWRFLTEWYDVALRLRHVCTPSAGRERIAPDPRQRSTRHFGAFHGQIMAESVLAMMLFMNRRLGTAVRAQQASAWNPLAFDGLRPLAGQIALLLGYGAIAKHVASSLRGLGVRVHGFKRDVTRGGEGAERVFGPDQLPAALALADHVVCLLPSDTGSDQLLDEAALRQIKASAFVYNLGRGNAIDESALQQALTSQRLAGAFLDVFREEPLPAGSPLWTTPNLYLTPHASAIRSDYLDLYFAEVAEQFE